ncbi:MAG: D-alanyl-D-alanine carboxypeptidase [Oscillospiraceae bacterium]|nr:D-alanyl-D-alanine carboxypeptidase [Oscillospiraceae bacterium]
MKKRQFLTLIAVFLFLSAFTISSLAVTGGPDHQAHAVVLADTETGDIIFALREHERIHPASTTKIMTALLVVEAIDRGQANINDLLTATASAIEGLNPAGASLDLEVGEEMTLESLLFAIMLTSANDASNVLAEYIGGSVSGFVQMMNDRARELGAQNTNFANTHGLTEDNHYSTAYDLFRITQHAITHPYFAELYSAQERPHAATNMRPAGIFVSTNRMMDPDSDHFYPGVRGVKTGFTQAAGWCLISTATQGEISLIAVVMGVPTGNDGVNHFTETAAIYDWAFENLEHQEILSATRTITRVPVELGEGAETVGVRPAEAVTALLLRGTNADNIRQEYVIHNVARGEPLVAPITQGDILGFITLSYGDRTFGPIPLVAAESVRLSRPDYMRGEIQAVLENTWVRVVIGVLLLLLILYIVYSIRYAILKKKRKKERMGRK